MAGRAAWTDSALVRLLTGMAPAGAPRALLPGLAEGLAERLDWTDAIALAAALDGPAPRVAGRLPARDEAADTPQHLRAELARTLDAGPAGGWPDAPGQDAPPEFAPYRHHYLGRQQAMDSAIGALRGRLRLALAARSPALARLAAVDAAIAQALGVHEQTLLGRVPALLARHFARLRGEALAAGQAPAAWLPRFHGDLRALLHAELDFRLQALHGLAAALQAAQARPEPETTLP